LEVIAERDRPKLGWRLLNELAPVNSGNPAGPAQDTEPEVPMAGIGHYQKILAAGPKGRAEAVTVFRDYLSEADDETYRLCSNLLVQQVYGEPVVREVSDEMYLAGLRLVWLHRSNAGNQLGLFEAIAGAVVNQIQLDKAPEAGTEYTPGQKRRFNWLVMRLHDPAGTQNIRL